MCDIRSSVVMGTGRGCIGWELIRYFTAEMYRTKGIDTLLGFISYVRCYRDTRACRSSKKSVFIMGNSKRTLDGTTTLPTIFTFSI